MQHVGVREDHVRLVAQLPARLARRVAVVGARDERAAQERRAVGEPREPAELVLRERLGREEVERDRERITKQALQDGHVVRERLSGRRPRRDHHVLLRPREIDGARLVRVEAGDPLPFQRLAQGVGKRTLQIAVDRLARGDPLEVDQLGRAALSAVLGVDPLAPPRPGTARGERREERFELGQGLGPVPARCALEETRPASPKGSARAHVHRRTSRLMGPRAITAAPPLPKAGASTSPRSRPAPRGSC